MNPHPEFRRAGKLTVALLFGALALAPVIRAKAQSRGELLYSTHCITCHSTQMHWRENKVATNFATLRFQVRRWQDAAGLGWTDSDIQDVTRYLNETIYRYPPMVDPVTRAGPPRAGMPARRAVDMARETGSRP